MVMCRSSPGNKYNQDLYCKASLVYFPSQDAICASVIPRGVSTMWTCGVKRKLEDEVDNVNYFDQRQSVLNISMIKLHTQAPRKTELPLRRSVLIFNTLKTIETELHGEGVRWNLPVRPCLLPSIQSNDMMLDPPPPVTADAKSAIMEKCPPVSGHSPDRHSAMDTSYCDNHTEAGVSSYSTVTSVSKCMTQASGVDSVPSLPDNHGGSSVMDNLFSMQITQQGPLPTFSSLLDLDCAGSITGYTNLATSSSSCVSSSSSSLSPSSSLLPVNSSSSSSTSATTSSSTSSSPTVHTSKWFCAKSPALTDSLSLDHPTGHQCSQMSTPPNTEANMFTDYDFSSLDMDFFSFLPSNLKLPPLSAEDLQSLHHPETFSQNLALCNPKHADLHADDLDSIMQILVGM